MAEMTQPRGAELPRERLPDEDIEIIGSTVNAFKRARKQTGEFDRMGSEQLEPIAVEVMEELKELLNTKFRADWGEILAGNLLLLQDTELIALADTYEAVRLSYLRVIWRIMLTDLDVLMSVEQRKADTDTSVHDILWTEATATRDEIFPPIEEIVCDMNKKSSKYHDAIVTERRVVAADLYLFGELRERPPWPH